MMTREEINTRIEKKNKDIEKINKRIAKWSNGMNEEAKSICAQCEVLYDAPNYKESYRQYDAYRQSHFNDSSCFRQDSEWNKGPNMNELYSAYRDLAEAKNTLAKYQVQLDKLTNFENEEKIEVIWNFLQQWKVRANEFYHNNVKRYFELEKGYKEAYAQFKKENQDENGKVNYWAKSDFERNYWEGIDKLTKDITTIRGKYVYPNPDRKWEYDYVPDTYSVNESLLNKTLDDEVRAKYEDLIHRITEKAGTIVDAKYLTIGPKGDINGYIQGSKNKVHVETIGCGGWNIVCYHLRTLINIIK